MKIDLNYLDNYQLAASQAIYYGKPNYKICKAKFFQKFKEVTNINYSDWYEKQTRWERHPDVLVYFDINDRFIVTIGIGEFKIYKQINKNQDEQQKNKEVNSQND